MNRKVLGIVIISVLLVTVGMLYQQHGIAETGVKEIKNVGNKLCPVCGANITEVEKTTYEYSGKIYNVCSQRCLEEFKNNSDKYLSNIEKELQGQVQANEAIPQEQAEGVAPAPAETAAVEPVSPEATP